MRLLMIVSVAGLLGLASPASAQLGPPQIPTYGPFQRPGLSPYLNLLRNNNNNNQFGNGAAAANYFLGTVPEQQRRANAAEFTDRISALDGKTRTNAALIQDLDDRTNPDPPIPSGTPQVQQSLKRYFNNTGVYFPPVQRRR